MTESHTRIPLWEFPTKEIHPEGLCMTAGAWRQFSGGAYWNLKPGDFSVADGGKSTSYLPNTMTQLPWGTAQPPAPCDHPQHKALWSWVWAAFPRAPFEQSIKIKLHCINYGDTKGTGLKQHLDRLRLYSQQVRQHHTTQRKANDWDTALSHQENPKLKETVRAPVQREAHGFPLITFGFRTRSGCRKLVGRSVRIVLCSREKQWILKLPTMKWRNWQIPKWLLNDWLPILVLLKHTGITLKNRLMN